MSLRLASPAEIRARIDAMPGGTQRVPAPTRDEPHRTLKVDFDVLKVTNMLCLVKGSRASEVVTRNYDAGKGNTSATLKLEVVTHYDSGEEALHFTGDVLKKKAPTKCSFSIPLKPEYEPFAKPIWDAWERAGGNPCDIDRHRAYWGNRVVFRGLSYMIDQQIILLRDAAGEKILDANGKPAFTVVQEHEKRAGIHVQRHIRLEELEALQLTDPEITSYFRWSPGMMGLNPMRSRYRFIRWEEYFHKLLRRPPQQTRHNNEKNP